jgi:hypothetical protein
MKVKELATSGKCQDCGKSCPKEELGTLSFFQFCRTCRSIAGQRAITRERYETSKLSRAAFICREPQKG